jgi:hypothetical protein
VSQLGGDVILTVQRIDVNDRKVEARIAEALAAKSMPNENDLTGYLTRLMPPEDFLRFGIIRIDANLSGAAVTLSGQPKGTTPVPEIKVKAPASYDLRITKDGYIPFRLLVNVPPDGEMNVKAELRREGGHVAWYGHWWVATLAGAVVLGAVGTGIWLETRSPTEVPVGGSTN